MKQLDEEMGEQSREAQEERDMGGSIGMLRWLGRGCGRGRDHLSAVRVLACELEVILIELLAFLVDGLALVTVEGVVDAALVEDFAFLLGGGVVGIPLALLSAIARRRVPC